MSDVPRQTLRELIARHGPGLCGDAKRCEGLLRDLCGAHRREVNILVSALKERVPLDLLAAQNAMPRGLLRARLARRLEDQLALTGEAARWAVDSWALALGVVTDAELKEEERKKSAAAAARPSPSPPTTGARPPPGGEAEKESPAGQTRPTPPAPPPPRQPSGRPPSQAPAPVPRPTHVPRPAHVPPPAHAPRAPAARPPAAGRPPLAGPLSNAPSAAGTAVAGPQAATREPPARWRSGSWRGCLIGCFLLALLALALLVGAPFVVSILREEQQRMNPGPPPAQSQ